jgi:hypothetical protein
VVSTTGFSSAARCRQKPHHSGHQPCRHPARSHCAVPKTQVRSSWRSSRPVIGRSAVGVAERLMELSVWHTVAIPTRTDLLGRQRATRPILVGTVVLPDEGSDCLHCRGASLDVLPGRLGHHSRLPLSSASTGSPPGALYLTSPAAPSSPSTWRAPRPRQAEVTENSRSCQTASSHPSRG